jgi:glucose-1-phosphate thymidylyltransferase
LKGVVLAGGLGSRLRPLTSVTNKHLLPVYKPANDLLSDPTLVNAGIQDIMIVTGGNSAGDFLKLLGNGKAFGLKHLNYTYQEGEGGIAAALSLVEHFAEDGPICVILGDNIIQGNIRAAADDYRQQGGGAKILLKRVTDPQRFGVPELDGPRVVRIDEKTTPAKIRIRSDWNLHVRRSRVRHHPHVETFRARRTGNHRREQCLHRARRNDLGRTRRLVDRRRHF